jgi:hypothetical protein
MASTSREEVIRRVAAFLKTFWGTDTGFGFLTTTERDDKGEKVTGTWREHSFRWPDEEPELRGFLAESRPNTDIYFCPMLFNKSKRHAPFASASKWLYADLDTADPAQFDPAFPQPAIIVETSPGRYHGYWRLQGRTEPHRIEALNKGIAYKLNPQGADLGGWDLTQLLRLPLTRNFKYPDQRVITKLVRYDGAYVYEEEPFEPYAQQAAQQKVTREEIYEIINSGGDLEADDIITRYEKRLSPRALRLLRTKVIAGDEDRSARLWELECLLAEAGMTAEEIYAVVQVCPWNKYTGRRDEQERLAEEAQKAVEKAETKKTSQDDDEDNGPTLLESAIHIREFMAKPTPPPGWLIKDLWPANEQGMVSGEEGTFKSMITLDMAVSIASGTKCLNYFEVERQGPVVMIQQEVDDWAMQDRLRRVLAARNLFPQGGLIHDPDHVALALPDMPDLIFINGSNFSLDSASKRRQLEEVADKIKPVLIVLDPLYLLLGMASENSAQDIRPIQNWLLRFRRDFDTSLIVVHHNNKMGDVRGSSALKAFNSVSLQIERTTAKGHVTIRRRFRNFGQKPKISTKFEMEESTPTQINMLYNVETKELDDTEVDDATYNAVAAAIASLPATGATYEDLRTRVGASVDTIKACIRKMPPDQVRVSNLRGGRGLKTMVYGRYGPVAIHENGLAPEQGA